MGLKGLAKKLVGGAVAPYGFEILDRLVLYEWQDRATAWRPQGSCSAPARSCGVSDGRQPASRRSPGALRALQPGGDDAAGVDRRSRGRRPPAVLSWRLRLRLATLGHEHERPRLRADDLLRQVYRYAGLAGQAHRRQHVRQPYVPNRWPADVAGPARFDHRDLFSGAAPEAVVAAPA